MTKAHEFFSEVKITEEIREEVKKNSHLIGKKVKAIPEEAGFEEETFTIVGLMPKPYTDKMHCVLKSESNDFAVLVEIDRIGKTKEQFFYDPGFTLVLK